MSVSRQHRPRAWQDPQSPQAPKRCLSQKPGQSTSQEIPARSRGPCSDYTAQGPAGAGSWRLTDAPGRTPQDRRPRTAPPGCEVWALGVSCCTVRHRVPPAQVGPTDLGLQILLPGPPCAPPGPRASALRPVCLLSPPRAPAPCAVPTGPQQRPGRPCALACSEGPGPGLLVAGRGRGAG